MKQHTNEASTQMYIKVFQYFCIYILEKKILLRFLIYKISMSLQIGQFQNKVIIVENNNNRTSKYS